MVKIDFQTLKIEGFAGIQPLTIIKLDDPGLTVVTGPNGAGKTTRFSALVWCLYGTPLKPKSTIQTWEHKRLPEYQGTMVQVSLYRLGKKYRVIRCKDYKGVIGGAKGANRLIVEKDGETLWPKLKDKRDIQKALTELLGFSYNLFINSIVFPQKVTRFIESSGPERKAILEESFKMLWINRAAKLAREKAQVFKNKLLTFKATAAGIIANLESLQDMLNTMTKAASDFNEDKIKKLETLQGNIETLKETSSNQLQTITPILNAERDLLQDKLKYEQDPLLEKRNELTVELSLKLPERVRTKKALRDNESELNKTRVDKDTKCPQCHQVLPKVDFEQYISNLEDLKVTLQKKLTRLKAEIRKLEEQVLLANAAAKNLKDVSQDLRDLGTNLVEAREINLTIEGAKGRLEEMEKQVKEVEASKFSDLSAPVKRKIFENTSSLNKITKKIVKVERQIALHNWIIDVPLGSNGIKAYMFSKLVELVNYQLAILEEHTGFGVTLSVEGDGVRKNIEAIVTREGYPVSYADLSGGESNLVNVMISLAIGEVVTIEQPVNIRIFDESFEGLDIENVEVVANLLSQIKSDTSLFVITHQSTFNPQNCNRLILSKDER